MMFASWVTGVGVWKTQIMVYSEEFVCENGAERRNVTEKFDLFLGMRKAMQRQYLKRRVSQNFATKFESTAKNKFAKN